MAFIPSAAGVVYTPHGELRPFEGWNGPISVAQGTVDGREIYIIGAGKGGGPVASMYDATSLQKINSAYVFPEGFRGGINVAIDNSDIYAAIGPGGGPFVAKLDANLRVISTSLIGPEDNREGVLVTGSSSMLSGFPDDLANKGIGYYGTKPSQEYLASLISITDLPGRGFWEQFRGFGGSVDLITGIAPTQHPAFREFTGGTNPNVNEAYDGAAGLAKLERGIAVMRSDSIGPKGVLHEIAHLMDYFLGDLSQQDDFKAISQANNPQGRSRDLREYWADGLVAYFLGETQQPNCLTYFQNLVVTKGWR